VYGPCENLSTVNKPSNLATLGRNEVEREMSAVVERYGPWTAHGIEIRDGLFTRTEDLYIPPLVASLIEILKPFFLKPLSEMRILDLGCLEGGFAIEFGKRGASVVGVEAREASIAKAVFARDAMGLGNVEFVQDDVRNLTREKYGLFDLVLCWGLLYHLDAESVFPFIEQIAHVCTNAAVFDTHVSLDDEYQAKFNGSAYAGRLYRETGSNDEERLSDPWGSVGNDTSFWFTRESLCDLLGSLGFAKLYQLCTPPFLRADRIALICSK
jgi:2-polyprenyl-3-methyl-5-hydroxy-6-metoxy-1,4-benzoquinol methylase